MLSRRLETNLCLLMSSQSVIKALLHVQVWFETIINNFETLWKDEKLGYLCNFLIFDHIVNQHGQQNNQPKYLPN